MMKPQVRNQQSQPTLSSSESAPLADTSVEEETQEDKPTEEEPKTENTRRNWSAHGGAEKENGHLCLLGGP
ncbi:hypothetical protein KUCAC02_019721 [Chaenocephalus aceratus]|uniref:Uncharacterized protein n=1 Tax=Chaenocephalus aceratus TaxID=36190 RepID=A0ACB9VQL9_CHAAC|nr:hypothetical protein KUCAC02_019721 [Chaenocephalus aceratus]